MPETDIELVPRAPQVTPHAPPDLLSAPNLSPSEKRQVEFFLPDRMTLSDQAVLHALRNYRHAYPHKDFSLIQPEDIALSQLHIARCQYAAEFRSIVNRFDAIAKVHTPAINIERHNIRNRHRELLELDRVARERSRALCHRGGHHAQYLPSQFSPNATYCRPQRKSARSCAGSRTS